MSRIHFISNTHASTEAAARAAEGKSDLLFNPLPAVKTIFDFDLVEHIRTITSEVMRNELLNSLAFSCDAHINITLGRLLSQFYNADVGEDEVKPWESYSEFLHYVQSMENNKQLLLDMGIDAPDNHLLLQNLYSLRLECHRLLGDGKTDYQEPDLEEFIANPRLRTATPTTYLKWEDLAADEAEGDLDLKKEILESLQMKAKAKALQSLNWDKQRSVALLMLLRAFRLTDAKRDIAYDNEYYPFDHLPATMQLKLMQGARRAVGKFIDRAAADDKIDGLEFAKFRKERKPYLKSLDAAMNHPRFVDIE